MSGLAQAIEERLGKFIKLKQFHFRYTKEMIFAIVHDCSNWDPDEKQNEVANLRSAFDNIAGWGIPTLVDPPDIKNMGSVNERGFLMFFAFFLPSLEGTAGPKKQKAAAAPPPDNGPLLAEIDRLKALLASLESREKDALASNEQLRSELETAKASNEQLRVELESVKVAKQQLESNLDSANSANHQLQSEINSNRAEFARDRTLMREEIERLLAEERARLAEKDEELQKRFETVDELRKEIARLSALLKEESEAKKAQAILLIQAK